MRLAGVGLSWQEAPTRLRERVRGALDDTTWEGLRLQGGDGVVEIHTCARSLWLVTGHDPAWLGALLQARLSALLKPEGVVPQVRVGEDAARFLLRVTIGLDSFVEGEADIGSQVADGFLHAAAVGRSTPALNALHQSAAALIAEARRLGVIRPNRGLGALAVEVLQARGVAASARVGVVGAGEIGQRVIASLHRAGFEEPTVYNRTPKPGCLPLSALSEEGDHPDALVVCTAGPKGWLQLPRPPRVVVDLGQPPQVEDAYAAVIGLDDLLAGHAPRLEAGVRSLADGLVEVALDRWAHRLQLMDAHTTLERLHQERDRFLQEALEAQMAEAVEGLSPAQKKRVLGAARAAVRLYSHQVLRAVKSSLEAP